jgi:hypothetical protein
VRNSISSFIVVMLVAAVAHAAPHRFLGPHPIAAKHGGGFCYIETPHLHAYPPDHVALYQQVGDQYVFTGDPTPFGYDGERHTFYGHHPVATVTGAPVYCYLDGPHFHAYPPPDGDSFKIKDGVAFYVGPFAPEYQPRHAKLVNAEYRPYVSMRPAVTVTPPPEWHGDVVVAPPSVEVAAPSVEVAAPSVSVTAPSVEVAAPRVVVPAPPRVEVSAPGVIVAAPGVVVAPAPHVFVAPAPHVIVGAPGVVVGAPGVVVGAPGVVVGGGVVVEGHGRWKHHGEGGGEWHHDHGKHKGWFK